MKGTLEGFDFEWPKVDPELFPYAVSGNTEDLTFMVCQTEGSWVNVFETSIVPSGRKDAYYVLMKPLITAWLNAFSSGCVPADVLEVMRQATRYVNGRLVTGLCSGRGHKRVDADTLDGRIMTAYAHAIAPYVNDGTIRCENVCESSMCGQHGACSPLDGKCYCEYGWTGEACLARDCSGHGMDDGSGTCHCFGGYSGEVCDSCGAPASVFGKSYICRACPPAVCGFANGVEGGFSLEEKDSSSEDAVVFVLSHVSSSDLNAYVLGDARFPDSDGLPLPVRPGSRGLTCNCKYGSEANTRTSTIGSLVVSSDASPGGLSKKQRAAGNVYYDSRFRRSPGAGIITAKQIALQKRFDSKRDSIDGTTVTRYEDSIDAIDQLYYQRTMMEEMSEMCSRTKSVKKSEDPPTHQDLGEEADRDHDRITAFGIAITVFVAVILLGILILGIILLLMWVGVSVRANPFESRHRGKPSSRHRGSGRRR